MMSFGWRPMMSCYASQARLDSGQITSAQAAAENTAVAVAATPCAQSPTWFYALLGIAAFAGIAHGKKK